jgi:hypothetical protein
MLEVDVFVDAEADFTVSGTTLITGSSSVPREKVIGSESLDEAFTRKSPAGIADSTVGSNFDPNT